MSKSKKAKRKLQRKIDHRRLRRLARNPNSFSYFAFCVLLNVNPELFLQSKLRAPWLRKKKYRKLVKCRMK